MAHTFFERLSAMDAMFLEIEDAQTHMHMGAVGIYELGPLREPGGGRRGDCPSLLQRQRRGAHLCAAPGSRHPFGPGPRPR